MVKFAGSGNTMSKSFGTGALSWVLMLILLPFLYLFAGNMGLVSAADETDSDILPIISDFSLSPGTIDAGSTATLSWSVINASQVSIDQYIGGVPLTGKVQVSPAFTTTYKLTAVNEAGVRSRYVTLSVTQTRTGDRVNCDPVTGRNAEVDFQWEQLCLSKQYQVQIGKDPAFTLLVYDSFTMEPADVTSPAFLYAPGMLEAGHTYYWRVRTRQAATGQYILSPWSEVKQFSIEPGYPVRTGYYGISALNPANGCQGCAVASVSFSWSGYPNTTKYRFILAKDHQLQDIVVEALVSTTSYVLNAALEYDTNYFWQVMAVEPVPSDPSSVFGFHTESVPKPVEQPVSHSNDIPRWAWATMIIGGILIVFVVFLMVRAGDRRL